MFAIRAQHAFDGDGFLPGGATVVVDGDAILGIEPLGYDVPADCPTDTYEGTLLPGLFDAHVHLVSDAGIGSLERAGSQTDDEVDATIAQTLRQQVAAGVTTVRDLGDVRYRTVLARDQLVAGQPRIVAAGPPLTVPDGHCHYLGGVVGTASEIDVAVRERKDRGVDVVKVMASGGMTTLGTDVFGVQFAAEDLRGLVDAAHGLDLRVLAHAHSLAGIEQALDARVDGIEHFTGLTEDGIRVPEEVLDRVAEAGLAVDLTLGFDPAVMAAMPAPPPGIVAMLAKTGMDFASAQAGRAAVAARVRERGIRVVTGVDAGAGPAKAHGNVAFAILDLLAAGFSVTEAVRSATSVAAEDCGLGTVTGRLAVGLAADLLVVDGDVAADPTSLHRPVAVVVRGVPVTA